ncbi:MAG: hypothetical protein OXI67_02925 [Candidatus Poribacteria bacterium]|nr:hypothetical protein [Candidatus Poribacteria bacterium]
MSIVDVPTKLRVELLLNSVKQLSSVELDEFTKKLAEWQQEVPTDESLDPDASDDEVLAFIRKNIQLPERENQRYWELRGKSDDETLTDAELPEYQELVCKLTILNTKRLEGIAILVHRWEKPAEEIIAKFGLKAGNDVL